MNVWPPVELMKTLNDIGGPVLRAPLVAWDIYSSLLSRLENNEVITLGEFGTIVGFSIVLLCVGFGILVYCMSVYDGMSEEEKKDRGALIRFYRDGFIGLIIGLYLALYFLLKLFYNY